VTFLNVVFSTSTMLSFYVLFLYLIKFKVMTFLNFVLCNFKICDLIDLFDSVEAGHVESVICVKNKVVNLQLPTFLI